MSKPREFWIDIANVENDGSYEDEYGLVFTSDAIKASTLLSSVHTIEYSAFEAMRAENEKLREGLREAVEALKLTDRQDRSRGYPTGIEWAKLRNEHNGTLDKLKHLTEVGG